MVWPNYHIIVFLIMLLEKKWVRGIYAGTSALGIMEFKIVFVVPSLVVYAHPRGCLESVCLKIAVVWAA